VANLKPDFVVKVDLDDRSFIFPAGKAVTQLAFFAIGKTIHVEAMFPFNESRTPPRFLSLDLEDARDLAKHLVEAIYQARTQLVISGAIRITINVFANGCLLQIGDMNQSTDLFFGAGSIWRVCQGLLRIIDLIAPVESN
jgi:hypothetical protein